MVKTLNTHMGMYVAVGFTSMLMLMLMLDGLPWRRAVTLPRRPPRSWRGTAPRGPPPGPPDTSPGRLHPRSSGTPHLDRRSRADRGKGQRSRIICKLSFLLGSFSDSTLRTATTMRSCPRARLSVFFRATQSEM